MRPRDPRSMLLSLIVALPLLGGCVVGDADIEHEVDAVAWDLRPLHLEPQVELSFGRAVLGLASTVARWSDDPDADLAAGLVDGIRAVHVGFYDLEGSRADAPDDLGPDAREELEELGWRVLVRTRDFDESQWVFAREDRAGRIEMLVVGLEDRELAVIRLEGDLGAWFDVAVRRERDLVAVARHARDDF